MYPLYRELRENLGAPLWIDTNSDYVPRRVFEYACHNHLLELEIEDPHVIAARAELEPEDPHVTAARAELEAFLASNEENNNE